MALDKNKQQDKQGDSLKDTAPTKAQQDATPQSVKQEQFDNAQPLPTDVPEGGVVPDLYNTTDNTPPVFNANVQTETASAAHEVTRFTVPASPLTPDALEVVKPLSQVREVEQLDAHGDTELPLKFVPSVIESVSVNGVQSAIGLSGTNDHAQGYGVIYDLEKKALVFAQEITGLVEVAYTHAPDVEQSVVTEFVSLVHDRLVKVEAAIQKLRDGGVV